ncbi:hypothetical protein BJ912DRAFT_608355 [Pholiota molesta]|nr:hypothetical protein BJ912DRAFT_608355 [Pholiota molesta]
MLRTSLYLVTTHVLEHASGASAECLVLLNESIVGYLCPSSLHPGHTREYCRPLGSGHLSRTHEGFVRHRGRGGFALLFRIGFLLERQRKATASCSSMCEEILGPHQHPRKHELLLQPPNNPITTRLPLRIVRCLHHSPRSRQQWRP